MRTPLRFVDGEGNMYHTNSAKNPTNCSGRTWSKENLQLVMCKTALERILYQTVKRKAECALHGLDGQLCLDRSVDSTAPRETSATPPRRGGVGDGAREEAAPRGDEVGCADSSHDVSMAEAAFFDG